jgi:hypothetical protein
MYILYTLYITYSIPLFICLTRARQKWAGGRGILSSEPILLLIDDLQWCDKYTLEWLQTLFHNDFPFRIMLISTLTPENNKSEYSLFDILPGIKKSIQVTEINLGSVDDVDTAVLVPENASANATSTTTKHVWRNLKGNPFNLLGTIWSEISKPERRTRIMPKRSWPNFHLRHKE